MNIAYITTPLIFLMSSVLSLYILAVVLRFMLQAVRADFRNPLCHALVTMTHPPLKFLRRIVPPIKQYDSASIVLALLLQMVLNASIQMVLQKVAPNLFTLFVISFANLIGLALNVLIFVLFAQALFSWLNPQNYPPMMNVAASLTNPVLNVCRKIVPDINGLDFSPLIAILLLQTTKMLLLPPLEEQLAHLF